MLRRFMMSIPGVRGWQSRRNAQTVTNGLLSRLQVTMTQQVYETILNQQRYQDPRLLTRHESSVFSQTGVDGILAEIFRRIGTTTKTFLEIGTESGIETNTTLLLWQNWRGWWIDGNSEYVATMRRTFAKPLLSGQLHVAKQLVTAENINDILQRLNVPRDLDLFSLDIDRNTYWVLKAMRHRPRVIVVEYNANIPPSVDWAVEYDAAKSWNETNYYGASLKAFELWGKKNGYQLVGCDLTGLNAFFVLAELCGEHFAMPATAETLHEHRRDCFIRHRNGHSPAFSD